MKQFISNLWYDHKRLLIAVGQCILFTPLIALNLIANGAERMAKYFKEQSGY